MVFVALLGQVISTSATGASDGPPYSGASATTSSTCVGSATPSPADCSPKLLIDARTGTIRADLSIRTPSNGQLPGWGETKGAAKLVAVRRLAAATRGARFQIRVRLHRLDQAERFLLGFVGSGMRLYGVAQHTSCSTCKGWSEGHQRFSTAEPAHSFATNEEVSIFVSLRNRDPDESHVPAGDVRVALVFAGRSVIYAPSCCSAVYAPPFVYATPPAMGVIRSRLWATVQSISRIA